MKINRGEEFAGINSTSPHPINNIIEIKNRPLKLLQHQKNPHRYEFEHANLEQRKNAIIFPPNNKEDLKVGIWAWKEKHYRRKGYPQLSDPLDKNSSNSKVAKEDIIYDFRHLISKIIPSEIKGKKIETIEDHCSIIECPSLKHRTSLYIIISEIYFDFHKNQNPIYVFSGKVVAPFSNFYYCTHLTFP